MAVNGSTNNRNRGWTPMDDPANQYSMGYAQAMASGAGVDEPGARYQAQSVRQRQQARQQKRATGSKTRTTNRTRTREYHIHINKGGNDGAGGAAGQWSGRSPIGDAEFLSAGHVRAFAERGRRAMRQAAMDFSYAHETLRAVLREVSPPQGESRGQMYLKANRTARSLKRAANAAQAASAHSARTWPAFMREYEPWLNQMGGPKPQARKRMNFGA